MILAKCDCRADECDNHDFKEGSRWKSCVTAPLGVLVMLGLTTAYFQDVCSVSLPTVRKRGTTDAEELALPIQAWNIPDFTSGPDYSCQGQVRHPRGCWTAVKWNRKSASLFTPLKPSQMGKCTNQTHRGAFPIRQPHLPSGRTCRHGPRPSGGVSLGCAKWLEKRLGATNMKLQSSTALVPSWWKLGHYSLNAAALSVE